MSGLTIEHEGGTTVTSGQVTLSVNRYPHGWNAVVYGWQIGAGFTVGSFTAACILIALSKIFMAIF